MTDAPDELTRLRRRLDTLEDRVRRQERAVASLLAGAAATLLVLGSLLPAFTSTDDEKQHTYRLVSAPFQIFKERGSGSVPFGIGFLGLLICVVVAVGICLLEMGEDSGPGTPWTGRVVAVLILLGMCVPIIFAIAAAGSDEPGDHGGPAMWVFAPGAVLFAITVLSARVRALWHRG